MRSEVFGVSRVNLQGIDLKAMGTALNDRTGCTHVGNVKKMTDITLNPTMLGNRSDVCCGYCCQCKAS